MPSGVTITSFSIDGYSDAGDPSYVTYNETQKSFPKAGTTQTWNVASPSAGGSISFTVETKKLIIKSITLETGKIYLTTTANMAGWRAFYDADQGYTLDANTTAYVATEENGGTVTMTPLAGGVPSGTPVILKTTSSADSYKMTLTKESLEPYEDLGNLLTWETSAVSNKYRLGYGAEGVGFYPYSGTPSSGAVILNVSSNQARSLRIVFGGEITDINEVKTEVKAAKDGKFIENGKLVIFKNGKKFNAAGQIIK